MRIAIVTSERSGLPARCVVALKDVANVELVGVIYAREGLWDGGGRRLRKKLRKMAAIGILGTLNALYIRSWFHDPGHLSLVQVCAAADISLVSVARVNDRMTAQLLQRWGVQLGISAGTVYIGKSVRNAPQFGFINVHLDKLPEYRNGRSILWSIFNQDPTTGISVHEVSDVIDGGAILHTVTLPILFRPTLKETIMATMAQIYGAIGPSIRLVCENYNDLQECARPQSGGSSYTTPTIREALRIWRNHRAMTRQL